MNLPEDLKHGALGERPASISAGVIAGIVVTVLVATDIAGCMNEDKDLLNKLVESKKNLAVAQRVNAYACGYLHGQRAIIQNARLRIQEPEMMESCPQFTDEAISQGFIVARRNR